MKPFPLFRWLFRKREDGPTLRKVSDSFVVTGWFLRSGAWPMACHKRGRSSKKMLIRKIAKNWYFWADPCFFLWLLPTYPLVFANNFHLDVNAAQQFGNQQGEFAMSAFVDIHGFFRTARLHHETTKNGRPTCRLVLRCRRQNVMQVVLDTTNIC